MCLPGTAAFGDRTVTVEDGDFTDWTCQVILEGGAGACSMTCMSSGGNPDACLEVSTCSGWELHAFIVMWKTGFTWDPSPENEIGSVKLEIDEKALDSFGAGQNLKLVVVQDGRFYGAPLVPWAQATGIETSWETLTRGPAEQDDFGEMTTFPFDPLEQPDFSPSGSPMHFGFTVGVSSVLDARIHAFDNWKITIEPPAAVPVDATTWGAIKDCYR
jgi:hypothetical protein